MRHFDGKRPGKRQTACCNLNMATEKPHQCIGTKRPPVSCETGGRIPTNPQFLRSLKLAFCHGLEIRISLVAVLADIQTFHFLFLGNANPHHCFDYIPDEE